MAWDVLQHHRAPAPLQKLLTKRPADSLVASAAAARAASQLLLVASLQVSSLQRCLGISCLLWG